jgi:hypothetical protein
VVVIKWRESRLFAARCQAAMGPIAADGHFSRCPLRTATKPPAFVLPDESGSAFFPRFAR